jgi:hypothetical protein
MRLGVRSFNVDSVESWPADCRSARSTQQVMRGLGEA